MEIENRYYFLSLRSHTHKVHILTEWTNKEIHVDSLAKKENDILLCDFRFWGFYQFLFLFFFFLALIISTLCGGGSSSGGDGNVKRFYKFFVYLGSGNEKGGR